MKPEQLSHRIGNIDDRLVEQAAASPGAGRRKGGGFRRALAVAAVLALMVGSFAIGAFAMQKEPETITVGDSGISIILPDDWAGKYGYETNGSNIGVYSLAAREAWPEAGYLFWIDALEGRYSMDYSYPAPGYTIAVTDTHTYCLIRASDVQYDPSNEAVAQEYIALSNSISEIQILLTDWMRQGSTNASNWEAGSVFVSYLDDWTVTETVSLDAEKSEAVAAIISAQSYSIEGASFMCDLQLMFGGEEYFMNSATGEIRNAAGGDFSALLSAADLQAILSLLEG